MFVTIREACKYTGVSEYTLRQMKKAGKLTGFDSPGGRKFHVSLEELAKYIGLDPENVVYKASLDKAKEAKKEYAAIIGEDASGMNVKLDHYGISPTRAHSTDAGLDIYSPFHILVPANGSAIVKTGVHVQLPPRTVGMIKSKSGLNIKNDITSEGVIDEGYTGEIVVKLYNQGDEDYEVQVGDKVTQLVVLPVEYVAVRIVDEIDATTERGSDGFGSTGR